MHEAGFNPQHKELSKGGKEVGRKERRGGERRERYERGKEGRKERKEGKKRGRKGKTGREGRRKIGICMIQPT
jgi:hypothetical protein